MKLKPGKNKVSFSVTSKLQGDQSVTASIYLWEYDTKIVISDIDGTITKSDVFGHILPALGRDWSHSGVAQLFSNITENGYQILYLTARAIGQSGVTKEFLKSISQLDNSSGSDKFVRLPDGPVFMSPDRILHSLNREVILRKPDEFKVGCLRQVQDLFDSNPFYAGFGNRDSDAVAYGKVGIPSSRTFIINPYGEVHCLVSSNSKTYKKLSDLVDEIFPAPNLSQNTEDEYYDYQYWKPLRRSVDPETLLNELKKSKK